MQKPSVDRPGVIARPPVLFLGFLVTSVGLNAIWRTAPLPSGLRHPVAIVLVTAAVLLGGAAVHAFWRAGTHIDPLEPARMLVTTGPYMYTRNPMYVALTFFYAGVGVALNNLWTLVLLLPFLAAVFYGVILHEESYLERTFGEAYRQYKASVRRWA